MKCEGDIVELAYKKLAEAECLLSNQMADGAFYLAGYSVELMIKARICKTLGIPDFYNFGDEEKKKLRNEASITKPYKVHDLLQLITLSGLYAEFETAISDQDFYLHWSKVITWNEASRYYSGLNISNVKIFVFSVKYVMGWIQKHL